MSELDWQLPIMSDTFGSPDQILSSALPCENYNNTISCFMCQNTKGQFCKQWHTAGILKPEFLRKTLEMESETIPAELSGVMSREKIESSLIL